MEVAHGKARHRAILLAILDKDAYAAEAASLSLN